MLTFPLASRVKSHVENHADSKIKHQEEYLCNERAEVLVVTLPYAVANKGAVMIEYFDAVVAVRAMRGPQRPVNVAGCAVDSTLTFLVHFPLIK